MEILASPSLTSAVAGGLTNFGLAIGAAGVSCALATCKPATPSATLHSTAVNNLNFIGHLSPASVAKPPTALLPKVPQDQQASSTDPGNLAKCRNSPKWGILIKRARSSAG